MQAERVLAVGALDGQLRFYSTDGTQVHKERRLVPHPQTEAQHELGTSSRLVCTTPAPPKEGAGSKEGARYRGGRAARMVGSFRAAGDAHSISNGEESKASAGGAVSGGGNAVAARDVGPKELADPVPVGEHAWTDPLSLAFLNGDFLLVGGTDR
jgi:hypothetical protein